jgi:arsenate reductase
MKRVLFLCTGNSCRSQMAEGFARSIHGDAVEAHSAGIVAKGVNPLAARAMAEVGIDISQHTSDTLDTLPTQDFDVVITVCGHAHEHCPIFPGDARVVHVPFDDPPALAEGLDDEQAMPLYRRVRDEIRAFVANELPGHLEST